MSTSALRQQIEAALSHRIPSALTPAPRILRPVVSVGIPSVDELLEGGLPLGAITELVGPESSGRTSFALSFLGGMTQAGKVCAWVDVSNALHPESAAAAGVDLARLLWVRCGVSAPLHVPPPANKFALPKKYLVPPAIKKGLHGGGFGPHPRNEVKGISDAVSGLLKPGAIAPRCAEPQQPQQPQRKIRPEPGLRSESVTATTTALIRQAKYPRKAVARIAQALRATDLLLQAGGFSAVVLDLGSIEPEYATRVPLATWFRYRAAAEKSQASIVLLTQHPCAKSSAGVVLRLRPGNALREEKTVFTGIEYRVEVARERFKPVSTKVIPLRKPPQRATEASWQSRAVGAGLR